MRLIVFGLLALAAMGGNAVGFNCTDPASPAVAVVCSDPELIKLTQERQRVWKALHDSVGGAERKALVDNERQWLAHYPEDCGVTGNRPPAKITDDMRACFKKADNERIAYMRAYGTGGTVPAAATAAPKPKEAPAEATAAAAPPPAPAPPTPAAAAKPTPPAPAPAQAAPQPAAPAVQQAALPATMAARPFTRAAAASGIYHVKFTFACQTTQKLSQVLGALDRNDIGFALAQTDCLPLPAGREASLISVSAGIAKIKLCSEDAGCTEVYAQANKIVDPAGQPIAK